MLPDTHDDTHLVQTLETFDGGVANPRGFRAAGQYVGIKADGNGLDLALIVSDTPATAAAVFTINKAQAAPVTVSKDTSRRQAAWLARSS